RHEAKGWTGNAYCRDNRACVVEDGSCDGRETNFKLAMNYRKTVFGNFQQLLFQFPPIGYGTGCPGRQTHGFEDLASFIGRQGSQQHLAAGGGMQGR
ncbi:hypothetical protein SCA31_22800, partial [Chryseobacterium sp. SIMBA_028]